jgi:uncharacterized protein (UPF0335 family)
MTVEQQPGVGHNSGAAAKREAVHEDIKSGGVATERLRSLVERVENLESEKIALTTDIREIYMEAKSAGFDPKVMRHIVKLRRQDAAVLEEFEAQTDVYKRALGM